MAVKDKNPLKKILLERINSLTEDNLKEVDKFLKELVSYSDTKDSSVKGLPAKLLDGPTMSNDQYETFKESRKLFNKWREN